MAPPEVLCAQGPPPGRLSHNDRRTLDLGPRLPHMARNSSHSLGLNDKGKVVTHDVPPPPPLRSLNSRVLRTPPRRTLVRHRSTPTTPGTGEQARKAEGSSPRPSARMSSQGPRLHSRHNAVWPRALLHLEYLVTGLGRFSLDGASQQKAFLMRLRVSAGHAALSMPLEWRTSLK